MVPRQRSVVRRASCDSSLRRASSWSKTGTTASESSGPLEGLGAMRRGGTGALSGPGRQRRGLGARRPRRLSRRAPRRPIDWVCKVAAARWRRRWTSGPTTSGANLCQRQWWRELRPRLQDSRPTFQEWNCTPTHQCEAGVRPSLEGLPYNTLLQRCT